MARGFVSKSESRCFTDERTGVEIRQVTAGAAIHHHPFYFIPAYDDRMERLYFVSDRTGRFEVYAEIQATGEIVQLTEEEELVEWSVHPSHDGRYVYYLAGTAACRVNTATLEAERLIEFGDAAMREQSMMVAAGMGTTTLSRCDRWWAIPVKVGGLFRFVVLDTESGQWEVILERDCISHPQFCPDDPNLLFYAGPLNDRVWVIRRDGTGNRRLYERRPGEWITHEVWIPGTLELAFVDWPHGIRAVHVVTGRQRRVTSFNAWHASCNRSGTLMVADTNYPDIGLQLFDPRDGVGAPTALCHPHASNAGEHWAGPFPYENGPVPVYAPQHTHPHPSFSPDGRRVVFTSDRTGFAQVYEVVLPEDFRRD